jgi:hypothetical protein
MNYPMTFFLSVVWMLCAPFCNIVFAQSHSCTAAHAMGQMARAKSMDGLNAWKIAAGDSHLARGVYFLRLFELKPSNLAAARAVLTFIPRTEDEDLEWSLLAVGPLCANEELADSYAVADLNARRPHDLALAVILVPEKMFDYVFYAEIASLDMHSDFAEQMEMVCRTKNKEFLEAINRLPPASKDWFLMKIFNPDGCHALSHPEADN